MLTTALIAKTNIIAGIVILIFLIAILLKMDNQDRKDWDQDDYDRWNNPENWKRKQ